ncbi:MAG TPA: hypothetical protein VFK84_08945 [Burkholderiales bacterium]|nr:hypothetical protein [Burkholderiales bacterium]
MTRTALSLSALALAVLAGCATEHRVASAPAPVVVNPAPAAVVVPPTAQPGTVVVPQAAAPAVVVAPAPVPLRAGYGRIESIVSVPPSAAAGGSAPGANKRLTIRMEDGSAQYVDSAANLAIGDRVQLTADGRMIHPAP